MGPLNTRLRIGLGRLPGTRRVGLALTAAAWLCLTAIGMLADPTPAQAASAIPAAAPTAESPSSALVIEDPFEGLNRSLYKLNHIIDQAVLRPLALGYEHRAPRPLQKVLHNLVVELSEPVVFGNDVLQLHIARAAGTATRFIANATIGFGGLLDPATKWGLPHHNNGFGTTLGRYGVQPGPYLFLPLFGPSNFRDLIGQGVDFYSDPISRIQYEGREYVMAGIWIIGGIDQRANAEGDLEQIDQMGADPYATLRSLYLQNRQSEIHPGQGVNIEDLPDFDETPTSPAPAAPPAQPGAPSPQSQPAPAATDSSAAAPTSAAVASAPVGSDPDAAYFLAPPAPPPPASSGPPLEL